MAAISQPSLRLTALLLLGAALAGCAKSSPTSAPMAARQARPVVSAPVAPPLVVATPAPAVTPMPTGAVALSLNALQAPGIAGVGIELTGPGLTAPVGKVLTPKDLEVSNTLVFEHLPAGALTARVVALGESDQPLAEVSSPVTVKAGDEARVALLLSATPGAATGGAPVSLRFVAPDTLATPKPEPVASATPRPVSPASRALSLEIVDQQVQRKFLLLKRLQVTVRVTNDNPTETLRGEVKVQFHKLKGLLTKTDAVVETRTAPVESLAPGKSVEVTVTSTVSAEDARATVHTVVASSSASTRDDE